MFICYSDLDDKFSGEAGKGERDAVINEEAPLGTHETLCPPNSLHGPCKSLLSSSRGNCLAPGGVWLLLFALSSPMRALN